ncbi:MAG: hypothetical protein ABIP97_12250 [Chthoniobacterales bacterium]
MKKPSFLLSLMKCLQRGVLYLGVCFLWTAALSSLQAANAAANSPDTEKALHEIKSFLVTKVGSMDVAAHDFVKNADTYQQIIDGYKGDYNRAAIEKGPELLHLIAKMQSDYHGYHNNGYETIEGITAGSKNFVEFDNYLDAGVPKADASTDSPYSTLILKTKSGHIISDRNGNLFHYVNEPTLWGTKPQFVVKLSPEAASKLGIKELPKADVLTAAAQETAHKIGELYAKAKVWQPTLDECVGALVWMTPTLNGYFDDWRDSRYDPAAAAGRYVAESRVVDMRGIMSSLQIVCNSILPELRKKNPALADQLKYEYQSIMNFIARVDSRDKASGGKMSISEIEEMAYQAKALTDQIAPHLKQMVAILGLKLPRKPTLA